MIIRNIMNFFKHEEEYYFQHIRVVNFSGNNYFDCESNGDINKTLTTKEYLNKIISYFKPT